MKDRLAEIKHWYALHLLPQRRLMEDIHWMVNRIEELESIVELNHQNCVNAYGLCDRSPQAFAGNAAPTGHTHPNNLDACVEPRIGVHS